MSMYLSPAIRSLFGETRYRWTIFGMLDERTADASLLLRIRERDDSALEGLYDKYAILAFTLAVRILDDRMMAEDVVQEAFLSVWRNAARFEPASGSFKSWFVTIVRNRCFDRLRSRGAQPQVARDVEVANRPGADDVAAQVVRGLTAERVRNALDGLPSEQRETVEMAYFGGLSQTEIAEKMRVPLGTVKGRVRMAMGKLRELLSGLEEEGRA